MKNSLDEKSRSEARDGWVCLVIQNKRLQQLSSDPESGRRGFGFQLFINYVIVGKLFIFSKPQVLIF